MIVAASYEPSMEIFTARLKLRRLVPADVTDTYVAWMNDPEVFRFLETRYFSQDEENIREFVRAKAASDTEFLFGIFLRDDGRHIGNIKVGPIHEHHSLAGVSLLLGARDCWGKGYATEAITALSHHAFDVLGVSKLSACMYAENSGSRRAFIKAGFTQEGLRRRHYSLDGCRSDVVELGALPGEIS